MNRPNPQNRPLIALMGPTASGKTAAALDLADWLAGGGVAGVTGAEIVSVDSALVYRGMDIGTAKPDREELARLPHHLIDICEPDQPYSAARFAADARAAIEAIRARGRLPLLVGGTMLYFKALLDGIDALPEADAEIRAELDAKASALGWPALHCELARIDPATAARLQPNDAQRIQRALEVHRISGRTLTDWFEQARRERETQRDAGLGRVLRIALEPSDRAVLHRRIAERFDVMLEAGFVDEVRALRDRPELHPDLPAIRAVGYRQAWAYLDGDFDLAELRARGIAATRQLAKRQLTWLRGMPDVLRIDSLAADAGRQLRETVANQLRNE
ncbi:tRNA (adenosine(37)-N6)-dimethylallyltransferase MiaA [Derxia lacustris]|uniref:tRNA (adenosine(37)-N6)-dimethylallyltransferase MiaA n=1 Tax=Derxia lacustris TaxID=764842 RepID=UPI000A16D3D1|nr:tRNA (adenosine(37)-N6)-dimethylallyltransferase MiaA [Derxia lacustris]